MEFKRKLHLRRKVKKAQMRKEKGLVRRKVRGRKRWMKAKPRTSSGAAHSAVSATAAKE